jgi:hypothetical protein
MFWKGAKPGSGSQFATAARRILGGWACDSRATGYAVTGLKAR